MKEFFNIKSKYKFEVNDLRAGVQMISVALIMIFGLVASWFGLGVSVCELANDLRNPNRHINEIVLHGAIAVLNIYFLTMLYC